MYLTPSVPNLCTLIQYLSVRGCQTWQSAAPPSGSSKLQPCSKLPTVTSYCRNEIPTSRKVPSMHTSPDTLAWPCHSDPTLAIRHAMTQTPTRIPPISHECLPNTTHLHRVKRKLTLTESIANTNQTKNSTPPSKSQVSCPGLTNLVCSSTGTTVDSSHGPTSVQPTKHTPCQYLPNLQTDSRPTKQVHDPHDP